MKIGIIIIFHNNEKEIDRDCFIEHSNLAENLELCLVNNDSKDNTFKILQEIKEVCANVSVVNIKKLKSEIAAVRAGARYMFNQFDLQHIGFVSTNSLNTNQHGLNELIKRISENQKVILKYNINTLEKKEIKQTLFQSLFSVIEYLKQLNEENHIVHLQY
ncbi:MAG: glycosyltransferase [Flavobacteriaceae bacterium]|nr:glycosyltransferase [Bacteroidia bacterium]NNL16339.1 glycosyltransferase [Flavobacteriaceae bacterium]